MAQQCGEVYKSDKRPLKHLRKGLYTGFCCDTVKLCRESTIDPAEGRFAALQRILTVRPLIMGTKKLYSLRNAILNWYTFDQKANQPPYYQGFSLFSGLAVSLKWFYFCAFSCNSFVTSLPRSARPDCTRLRVSCNLWQSSDISFKSCFFIHFNPPPSSDDKQSLLVKGLHQSGHVWLWV